MEVKVSCRVVSISLLPCGLLPARLLSPWNFPGKSTGVSCHFLHQGIFPTEGLNLGLLHGRQILYQLTLEKPRKLNTMIHIKKKKKNTLGQSGVYSRNPRLVQYLKVIQGTSLVVQWLRLCSNAGGLGSIPSQGTRSHVLQPRIHMPQLKILHATTNVKDPTCHN